MSLFTSIGGAVGDITGAAGAIASPAIGGLAPGASLGDVLTGGAISDNAATNATNAAQEQLADQQMAFQQYNANTTYQRGVADMKAAGLNPMLAYSQGGDPAPSGTQAQLTAPSPGQIGAGLLNTASSIASKSADIANTKSQTALAQNNADLATAKIGQTNADTDVSRAQVSQTKATTAKTLQDTRNSKASADLKENAAEIQKARQSTDVKMAPVDAYSERIEQALGTISSGVRAYKALGPGSSYQNSSSYDENAALEKAGVKGIPLR